MKTDLATAIIAAIVGVVLSYFLVDGLLLKNPADVVVKKVEDVTNNVDDPNPEVFNYRAVNPTVETYIDCKNYDLSGNCLEKEQQTNPEN